jgi:CRISPR-associated endonuclease/helicase Cas3
MILSGLLITADWIASNTEYFPLISIDEIGDESVYQTRIDAALEELCFSEMWESKKNDYNSSEFRHTFGFSPNKIQQKIIDIIKNTNDPGLFIFEAPMGCGKTEAALSSAELLAAKCEKNGIFFGMPTQATTNGIFPRIINWAEKHSEEYYHSIQLKHGSAEFNEVFRKIQRGIPDEESDSGLIVHSWFCNNKRACLANFVVATVDQMLMMALKRRHVMLLHLGLSEKVVIIDEVHAYDAYMNRYLERALQWLGAYHTPVILLSATLPAKKRMTLVRAYLGQKRSDESFEKNISYPLLTYTDGDRIKQESLPYEGEHKNVKIAKCTNNDMLDIIHNAVRNGGCVGVIMNTVSRAQNTAEAVRNEITDNVLLYHAQFIMPDRAKKEEELLTKIGKDSKPDTRAGFVVIGTQVLEQSLDIDFDLLITDICPIDLLLQRIGRLHRHSGRIRPDELKMPECYVVTDEYDNPSTGSKNIYGEWLLKKTLELLPENVLLPDDISPLVQQVYNAFDESETYQEYVYEINSSENRAEAFLVDEPDNSIDDTIHGLLDKTIEDNHAESSVRDGISSLEILLMKLYDDGSIGFIGGEKLSNELSENECERIAQQKLRLPSKFSQRWNIIQNISEIKNKSKELIQTWQKSYFLKDHLVVFLNENNETELCGYTLSYDQDIGLVCK